MIQRKGRNHYTILFRTKDLQYQKYEKSKSQKCQEGGRFGQEIITGFGFTATHQNQKHDIIPIVVSTFHRLLIEHGTTGQNIQ